MTRTRKFEEIARETGGLLTHWHRSRCAEAGMGKAREMRLNRWQDHLVRQSADTCEQLWLTKKGN